MEEFDIKKHNLVPEHIKISEEEKEELLKRLNVVIEKLPMIQKNDPAIRNLEPKIGDIIKVIRNTPTHKSSPFYRVVTHG